MAISGKGKNNLRLRDVENRAPRKYENKLNPGFWLLAFGAILLTVLLVVGIPATLSRPLQVSKEGNLDSRIGLNDDVLSKNPGGSFYGTRVDLTGEIDKVLNDQAFVVDGPGLFGDQLLVVTRQPLSNLNEIKDSGELLFDEDNKVVVTGIVREFDIVKLENDLGVELNENDFIDRLGDPVVIADSISIQE